MAANTLGLNQIFPIYNEDGTPFHDLVLRKGVVDSVVMSLGDKITGDVFYKDNTLQVTMKEYVEYNGIHFSLVNPPTIVREGMVADNSELKGMTKYSFEFYHPMCQLSNFPFTDVATKTGEEKYLSQNKTFSWIGKPQDYIDKLNRNLQGTVWYVRKSDLFPVEKDDELSEVQQFDNVSVAEAIKRGYEIWEIPYIVSQLPSTDPLYAQGKRFVVEYGLPSNEIYENESARQLDTPYVFQIGQGVGLKNNSRTPRNNKIVTRIAGYGSENNVPYGYPQIVWTGNQDWDYTINNNPNDPNSYPIYKGIVGGQYVKLIKHPFTRTHLMPSIFTETVNKKVNPNAVGYDPTIEIKDYYDAVASQDYPYVNEINLQAPSYESHEFADIKPEFDSESSIGIISAIPLNSDLTPADHWDDSMDDDGNYLQSYFQITLPQLDFDLYACAAITQEMQINMRSGACIGCTFPIQVDWDDYKKNFYDEDGNFVPDGEQRDLTKYPKSNLGQISVVVQKDNSTFGTLMPNIYQQPKANDLFVFIGISLPVSYITNAEERLDDAMKTYMLENNVFYFDYPLKFDEHFLTTHTYILEQIRPNSIIRFDYGGVEQQLFVKQLTVKYGNAPLPQYDITLTDNIEVVLNQIGQVADDVEKLSSLISVLRQSYSRNVWNELAKKLSKTQDDTAQGYIRFLKGLQVGSNFVPDILGEGGVLRMRDDGKVELVTDILYARVKAYFDTVEIREYKHTAGNRIASVAGNKCVRVAWFNSSGVEIEQTPSNLSSVAYFRCFFRASDGDDTVRNNFSIGDQAYCHVTSIATGSDNPEEKGLNQKHFWRLVIGRNADGTLTKDDEAYIDLSNRAAETIGGVSYEGYQSGSDVPQAQDDIIQLGNVNDTTRQGAIVEFVTGTDAPSYQIYQGINSFSLNGKNQIGFGYNTGTGRAYMNVYGDFRFGSRNNNGSYIKYNSQTGNLEIKAHVEFTNSDTELDTLVQEHQRDDSYDDSWIQPAIDELQDQIDGAIETYYMVGEPALNLPPVVSTQEHPYDEPWLDGTETQEERTKILNNHVGDLYYDKDTGHGYRFLYDDSSRSFVWVRLTDEDIEAALEAANNAQATADGKMTIYSVWGAWVKNSINTLKVGDLFIPANDTAQDGTTYYARKVYKCTVAGQNSFSEINYTDDSALNDFKANQYVQQLTNGTITNNITNAQNAANNAQGAANTAQSTAEGAASAAAALGYLSQALGQNTEVVGGLVLSTLIALRDANNNTWSGINGAYQQSETGTGYKGHGIAAWYGGAMVDKEVVTTATDYAKSLFRFDGSGYLAGGNITWDKDGIVTIANVYSDINGNRVPWSGATLQYITNLSTLLPITIQSGVTYLDPQVGFSQLSILGKQVATQEWVSQNYVTKAFFEAIFKPEDSSGNRVSTNGTTLGVLDRLKILVGAYTDQYLSALGLSSSSGGGGTGDVTWDLLANNSDTRQIALSHLTGALGGYATQSWVTTQLGSYNPTTNFKTINGNSIIGTGNITISGGGGNYLPLTGGTLQGNLTIDGYNFIVYHDNGTSPTIELQEFSTAAFSALIYLDKDDFMLHLYNDSGNGISLDGNVWATSFHKTGGTSSQFLKADGSVDSNAYITLASVKGNLSVWNNTAMGWGTLTNANGYTIGVHASSSDGGDWGMCYKGGQISMQLDGWYYQNEGRYRVVDTSDLVSYNPTSNFKTINNQSIIGQGNINIQGGGGAYYDAEVDYLESTGSGQYIDTGWFASYSDGFVIETEYEFSSSGNRGCFLSNYDSGQTSLSLEIIDGPRFYFYQGLLDYKYAVSAGVKHTTIFCYVNNVYSLTVDGVLRHSETASYTGGSNHSAFMFLDRAMRTDVFNKNLKIYRLKIKSGNNIVRDFIPVRVGNTGYMYDKVEKKLYGNLGSGSFILGNDISFLPTSGGTITGNLNVNGSANATTLYENGTSLSSKYLPLTGGTLTGGLTLNNRLILNGSIRTIIFNTSYTYISNSGSFLRIVHESTSDIIIGNYNDDNYTFIVNDLEGGTTDSSYTNSNQNWLIGNDGNAYFKSVGQQSDIRYKNVIGDVALSLYNVANSPLFKFTWKDEIRDTGQHIGTAAQYWQTILPELVSMGTEKNPKMSMQYDVVALASVITVAKTVVSHEERIKILENENKKLKKELEEIKMSA